MVSAPPIGTTEKWCAPTKILLDCVIRAIRVVAKGVRLWGGGGWKHALQIAYADDWCGTCGSEAELQSVWAVWQAWTLASGCVLGIDGAAKTVVVGITYDADGRPHNAYIRRLRTHDGRCVQQMCYVDAYML